MLVGARIDLRSLHGDADIGSLDLDKTAVALVFRHGAIVLFGATAEAQAEILEQILHHVVDPLAFHEIETATIDVRPDHEEQVDFHGNIRLRELTPDRLLLTGIVLARSVALVRHEIQIAGIFERIEPVIASLRHSGSVIKPGPWLMQQIGEILSTQHQMVGRTPMGDKPNLLWAHPELDRLYRRLEAEFELGDRIAAMDRKLTVLGRSADALLDLVHERRSVRLELAVIALIAFEICLSIFEKLVR